ncbi:MAG: RNA polymerase sigma-54 factor, partial [Muribaculaceae bacterium]|nr:RNA polymerase sigma-54 factor [Muribaculaceae bacterium]
PKDDNDASSHEIFAAMRQLIEQENPQHPLSDERLTRQLSSMGYDIARRTVAKYRERLGYPVARLRKKI